MKRFVWIRRHGRLCGEIWYSDLTDSSALAPNAPYYKEGPSGNIHGWCGTLVASYPIPDDDRRSIGALMKDFALNNA